MAKSKLDPFKGVTFSVPSGEESLRHVHRARAAAPPLAFVAFRMNNAYQFFHGDATAAAAFADLTLFKVGKVDSTEFPTGDAERVARRIQDAGKVLYVADPADAFPVAYEIPPDPATQAGIRARYEAHAAGLRHIRGECFAYWIMKEGKYSSHKGRKVTGAQVGPFVIHSEPVVNYAVTHESTGLRLGALPFVSMTEAKLFALLSGWNHSWDFPGKNFPEDEVAFVTALIKAWKAGRWDTIAKLCTLDSEPLVNEAEDVTADRSFADGHASEDAKLAIPPAPLSPADQAAKDIADRLNRREPQAFDAEKRALGLPVPVDNPPAPALPSGWTADEERIFAQLKGGRAGFKELSAVLDFDHRRTVVALVSLRNAEKVFHVEQAANAPLAQNFGPGDSFELFPEAAGE